MDINHVYGADIALSPSGDLSLSSPDQTAVQRCYRRLLTNPALHDTAGNVVAPGDMLAHQDYGAGVGRLIGSPQDVMSAQALIQGQMNLEQGVAQSPPPSVVVTPLIDGMSAAISFTDAQTAKQQYLSFDISK